MPYQPSPDTPPLARALIQDDLDKLADHAARSSADPRTAALLEPAADPLRNPDHSLERAVRERIERDRRALVETLGQPAKEGAEAVRADWDAALERLRPAARRAGVSFENIDSDPSEAT
jgi:uncharacterized membrane protein YccC